ncbi:FG-GAP-like repeat-containing protein [Solirubrobacter taibaiensis]|nr:FG-GAP-like repeat-containing protein [Solirubrobacter taibaiensis]
MLRWTLAVLLGAVLGGASAADAAVNFQRTDIPLSGSPGSVAMGDLDGRNGKDIAVALPAAGGVGVLLNNGDGTFGAPQPYLAGPQCVGQAVEVELGDVTGPAGPFVPDGKLDAYVTCSPYVVRLAGDGTGALGGATAFQLYLPPYLGSATIDFLALMRRPDGNPAPLLALQHSVGSFGRQLCISYELDSEALICSPTSVEGPLVVGDLNGAFGGVPPDELFTAVAGGLGVFGFAPQIPTYFTNSVRTVPGGLESAAVGDLDRDGRLDVLVGQLINSVNARVNSIHAFRMGATELAQVAAPLPSIPGLDAVAITDVDGDGCTDVVGAGGYGRGMIHLGIGTGGFDGGQDLPQLGYQNPATATRVSMAVGDLTGDGLPEIVIADVQARSVMVYANRSTAPGGACSVAPILPPPVDAVPVVTNTGAGVVPPSPTPTPPPVVPRTCQQPGTASFIVGTPGDDVLVGSNSRDVLSGRGGDDCLFGLGGADILKGGTGADKLKGSSGDDRLNGDAGDDDLRGDNGNDTITPGAGHDKVTAGGGNDTISARDSARDTIDCGGGTDKVTADRTDTVRYCEYVKRAKRRG